MEILKLVITILLADLLVLCEATFCGFVIHVCIANHGDGSQNIQCAIRSFVNSFSLGSWSFV